MRSQSGFTLIEVLVACAMLGVAVMFSMNASQLISTGYSYARHTAIAERVGEAELEELLAAFNSDARLTAGTHHQDYDQTGTAVATTDVFSADWLVTSNTPITKIMRIDLTVSWTENSLARTLHFTTFRTGS